MNNIISNFPQIINFAKEYGLPLNKKRAIIREYLQVKILNLLYNQKIAKKIYFVGGTSLRLLHGLDRFSEDLDFDFQDVKQKEIAVLMETIANQLEKEAIEIFLYKNITKKKIYFEIRFKNLLKELAIGNNVSERLTIKFDFEDFWQKERAEFCLVNRFGLLTNISTIPLSQIFTQKLSAYLNRSQTQARDIYDLIWLKTQGAGIDKDFLQANRVADDLINQAVEKYKKEEQNLKFYKSRLRPFLVNEKNADNLDFFLQVIQTDNT